MYWHEVRRRWEAVDGEGGREGGGQRGGMNVERREKRIGEQGGRRGEV